MTRSSLQRSAVIYTRVNTIKQGERGEHAAQEAWCREFAHYHSLNVVAVFSDECSGNAPDRPGIRAMVDFLRTQEEGYFVITKDMSRLARNVRVHLDLQDLISAAGGELISPSPDFGDVRELLLATVHQYQREMPTREGERECQ